MGQQVPSTDLHTKNPPVFEENGMPLDIRRRKALNEFNAMIYEGSVKIETVTECFCGDRTFELLSRYDRFGLPFGTQICRSCGLITQTLRLSSDSLPVFYEKIYWPLVAGQGSYSTAPKEDETVPYVLEHIPSDVKDGWTAIRIFEVGCGSGGRISRLRDELELRGYSVTTVGCDYSSQALKLAAQKGIQAIQGGMDDLRYAGKADILILSHVFEHFPDLAQATEQIDQLVHDDSFIYIEVPGVMDLENKREYMYSYQDYCVLAHTYNFCLSTLAQVMAKRGFSLIQGDEYVRSVFKKGRLQIQLASAYKQIMESLQRSYNNQLALEARKNNPVVKYLRNVAKALLGRES